MKTKSFRIESVVVALGFVLLGVFIYLGLDALATRDRIVSVRGLAEREVKANKVIWPVVYKTTGNDLNAIYADINNANKVIASFLKGNGIEEKEISAGAPRIIDLQADRYADNLNRARYNVTCITTVTTDKIELANQLMLRMGELLKQGIAISANDYDQQVQYEFTKLNEIKPAMIEEATKNARAAAEKFAEDSGSKLGKIKDAQQGQFSIEDRDQYTPGIKNVRIVTYVSYFLKS